jgi:reverse gyrase
MNASQIDPARGTGRTTRAVTLCLLAAASGKRVVYVVPNRDMVSAVKARARDLCGDVGVPPTFDVITPDSRKYTGVKLDRVAYDHYRGTE